jgi:hypothetical protein
MHCTQPIPHEPRAVDNDRLIAGSIVGWSGAHPHGR